jgi:hypothetical protein
LIKINKKYKVIKKIGKIFLITLGIILLLPIGAYLALRNNNIQNWLTDELTNLASDKLNANIAIGTVRYEPFNKLILEDIYIEDQKNDTLITSKTLDANINLFTPFLRIIDIRKLRLKGAKINFSSDTNGTLNANFIFNALKRKDTTKPRWQINFNDLALENSKFHFKTAHASDNQAEKINFSNIQLNQLNLEIEDFNKTREPTISGNIKNMSFIENSGFKVNRLTGVVNFDQHMLELLNLSLHTASTKLNTKRILFVKKEPDAWNDFINKIKIHAEIQKSSFGTKDITYFADSIKQFDQHVNIQCKLKGTINDLDIENIVIHYKDSTKLKSNLSLKGLPKLNETFIFHDIESFTTKYEDLKSINLDLLFDEKIKIPEELDKLGIIKYSGTFTGFINDFVAYGRLKTRQGTIFTDISLKPDVNQNIKFSGQLGMNDFNIGAITDSEDIIGHVSMNMDMNGFIKSKKIEFFVNGVVNKLMINKYPYSNIKVIGNITNTAYNGVITVNDPNLKMEMTAAVELADNIPKIDLDLNIPKANLYQLHIDKKDSLSSASFSLVSNLNVQDSNMLKGKLKIKKAHFSKTGKELNLADINCHFNSTDQSDQILITSDYVNGSINGQFDITKAKNSLKNSLAHYFPSIDTGHITDSQQTNAFANLDIKFPKISPIFKFFFKSFIIADESVLKASYNAATNKSFAQFNTPYIYFNNNKLERFTVNQNSNGKSINYSIETNNIKTSGDLEINKFTITGSGSNDSLNTIIKWANQDPSTMKGEIALSTKLSRPLNHKKPQLLTEIKESKFHYEKNIWTIANSKILIDTTHFAFNDFVVHNNAQKFSIDGVISKNPYEKLIIELINFDLNNINFLTSSQEIDISGVLNGQANLSRLYNEPVFNSEFSINRFTFNNHKLGSTKLSTSWNSDNKAFNFLAITNKNNHSIFDINGYYSPDKKVIDMKILLNKFPVDILNPYMAKTVNDLNGFAYGKLSIQGHIKKALINGNIHLQATSFFIPYLQNKYKISHNIKINNNAIIMDNLAIYDPYRNKALLNGKILLGNKPFVNISFKTNKFNVMQTDYVDNPNFYGNAIISGITNINGPVGSLDIDISAKTLSNTTLNIPLDNQNMVEKKDFIQFVEKKPKKTIIYKETKDSEDSYKVDLSGINLDFDLEVTDDVVTRIILNSEYGDVIKARGRGSLKIGVNKQDKLNIFGEYIISRGDYMFSLQNLINKRFKITEGSSIKWNGNPSNAHVDLKAVYEVKTSLNNLFYNDSSEIYTRRIPVECQIILTKKLNNPNIKFNIYLPSVQTEIQQRVASLLNTQEKISKQFLALLVINNFVAPQQEMLGGGQYANANNGLGAREVGVATTTELLSNQLSNWLSQVSDELEVGINYRPGTQEITDELEVALSTHLLNDRVEIRGNLDMGGNRATNAEEDETRNTSNIVGDFDINVKLNKSGKLRLKAYNRANENLLYEEGPYTQGVGLSYKEEFNSFSNLLKSYWDKITSNKKK